MDRPRAPRGGDAPGLASGHVSSPVVVFARWYGYADVALDSASPQESTTHVYSTSIPPETPLELGMRVRVLATTPAWYSNPEEDADTYNVYDAHVVGRITRVVGWRRRKIILEVENECAMNTVRKARIRIPFAPDVTIQMSPELFPTERGEAQESDLNTAAVVRGSPGDASCGAATCRAPWRDLVGESFLWEPTADDVADLPGARRGRKRVPKLLVSWEEATVAQVWAGRE